MSDISSGNDWELVTPGTLESSHSSSASASAPGAAADGGIGVVDSNMGSGYILCNSPTSAGSQPADSNLDSTGRTEQFAAMAKPTPEVPSDIAFSVEGMLCKQQVEEIEFSRGILMSESCHELSKFHWMEPPRPAGPGPDQLLEFEGSGLGSTSNPDAYDASKSKAGLEPDSEQQVGPLLGSCMSAPSSPSIVSRDNLFLEPDTLASVELHEKLLAHSAFISSESVADFHTAVQSKMGVAALESERSASALENERAGSEIWWFNKQAALRGVRGRQAGTYWSIALAAAVMGIIILGHRWQYERRQNQQLRLRLCVKEEKIGQLSLQLARMKEVLSSRRRVPVLRSNSYFNG